MVTRKLGKVAAAIGGFLIMMGMVLMGIFALLLFDILDVAMFMETEYRTLFTLGLLVIGVCDLVSGIILALR
ncbi:hypothetical protein DRO69_03105 [Candidatus Bathyarchaeota archaeon]|nr:MAG: hypothetical protein DRO69_03105 [Candidatus Bathyarchaeota archaeon]